MSDLDTVKPGWIHEVGTRERSVSKFPVLFTRDRYQWEHREWDLVYAGLTPAERATLIGVFEGARGSSGSTLLTPPGAGSQLAVAFVEDKLGLEREGVKYNGTVRVREVF